MPTLRTLSFFVALAAAPGAGCSLAVDTADQCQVDADCRGFSTSSVCNQGVCTTSRLGPPGCFPDEPTTDAQFRNRCTSSQCIAFDNCARLNLCSPGARLPARVKPPTPQ